METHANIRNLTNYPIVDSFPLPGNKSKPECLVIAKSEADKFKHFDSYLIGYAHPDDSHLSLSRWCKSLEFQDYQEALDHVGLMLSQE
ncbi:MAG TPA: hypothetical protein V6D33_11855 [Cyanophyceae cyanobacterium]